MAQLRFGNLDDLYEVAYEHEESLREQITLVKLEMSEFPLLKQRIGLSQRLEILTQELRTAEIKTMNLLCEMEFVNSKGSGVHTHGPLLTSLLLDSNMMTDVV